MPARYLILVLAAAAAAAACQEPVYVVPERGRPVYGTLVSETEDGWVLRRTRGSEREFRREEVKSIVRSSGFGVVSRQDGRQHEGAIYDFGDHLIVRTPVAGVTVPRAEVVTVEMEESPTSEYARRAPQARTVEEIVALAEWCSDKHLTAEAETQMRRALALDPGCEAAHRYLGDRWEDGRWVTAAELSLRRAQERLEDFRTHRKEKLAAGWIWFRDEWREPESFRRRYDDLVGGVVYFHGEFYERSELGRTGNPPRPVTIQGNVLKQVSRNELVVSFRERIVYIHCDPAYKWNFEEVYPSMVVSIEDCIVDGTRELVIDGETKRVPSLFSYSPPTYEQFLAILAQDQEGQLARVEARLEQRVEEARAALEAEAGGEQQE